MATNNQVGVTKHPKGLYVLFATEMWERFSFYSMLAMFTGTVGLYADTGSRYEPAHLNGIAHLFEHMVFKGAGSRTARELSEAIEAGADIVMLDNQTPEEARKLVEMSRDLNPNVLIEASGGMDLDRVRSFAEAGVDLISVGRLTHSARAVDISFKIQTM